MLKQRGGWLTSVICSQRTEANSVDKTQCFRRAVCKCNTEQCKRACKINNPICVRATSVCGFGGSGSTRLRHSASVPQLPWHCRLCAPCFSKRSSHRHCASNSKAWQFPKLPVTDVLAVAIIQMGRFASEKCDGKNKRWSAMTSTWTAVCA